MTTVPTTTPVNLPGDTPPETTTSSPTGTVVIPSPNPVPIIPVLPLLPITPTIVRGITPESLATNYVTTILGIVQSVQSQGKEAIPIILLQMMTQIVPQMVSDVGVLKNLSAQDKKSLIVQAIDLAIDQAFLQLANNPLFKNEEQLDNLIKSLLQNAVPSMFDTFLSIENNEMVVNKTVRSFFAKIFPCCCAPPQS